MIWKPIETAPESGWILGYDSELAPDNGAYMVCFRSLGERGWSDGEYAHFPTHWMPLPEPPK